MLCECAYFGEGGLAAHQMADMLVAVLLLLLVLVLLGELLVEDEMETRVAVLVREVRIGAVCDERLDRGHLVLRNGEHERRLLLVGSRQVDVVRLRRWPREQVVDDVREAVERRDVQAREAVALCRVEKRGRVRQQHLHCSVCIRISKNNEL